MKCFKSTVIAFIALLSVSANAAFIDFNDYTTSSIANQHLSGDATASADGSTLELDGNLWVYISDTFEIDPSTVLYFTLDTFGAEAENYGIGFNNSNNVAAKTFFQLGGTQLSRQNQIASYTFGDGAVDFAIEVGTFFTGSFKNLVFILDADEVSGTSSLFRNVELCSDGEFCASTLGSVTSVDEPSPGIILAMSILFLVGGRRIFN
ncbi:MAG: hypothetical protein CBB67_016265 [Alteromonadaceae bacterium TMED7]|uniref:hypothetical protein n=1 Tax=Alteromonas sp. TaxID=232 RepID=UPI000B679765|nr:hypothetical protein [Alteromonas sp.]MAI37136.1 hypothetical protein [Alteromonas sp.]RPH16078.1 MAG: hypothetical protein CBB67_016265 [Alteromonadaceae bacterium TMED7]|tara:strand:- start:3996 stop:4616 length:621 start_codon:yes stop_codon:yes gene_type:complete